MSTKEVYNWFKTEREVYCPEKLTALQKKKKTSNIIEDKSNFSLENASWLHD